MTDVEGLQSGDGRRWPADPLKARRERTPDRLALVDATGDVRWTYEELDAFVDRIVDRLRQVGVTEGDTVATLLDTRPTAVALPFATLRLGATLAPLNVELEAGTVGDQIDRLEPVLLLCSADTEQVATDRFDGPAQSLDAPTTSIDGRFDADPSPDSLEPSRTANAAGGPLDIDETALVVFTSGTTGRPKGVRLTRRNLLSSAVASAQRLGVTPRDRWFSPLSTYHVGGIAPYVRSTLYGTSAIFQRTFDAEQTPQRLAEYAVTCISFVPTMLSRVLDAGWRPGPAVRFVLLGGGPIPERLLDRCLDLDVPVCPTYGASETASQVATATPEEQLVAPGTVGRPLSGATADILAGGSPCEPGSVGELVVNGPMVSPGYLEADDTAEAFEGGRFRTGDLGYRGDEGRIWITGRADDVVVTGGENVRPSVVVEALCEHPAILDAAVVGIPDDEWGERVAALVVANDEVATDELRAFCRDRLPTYAVPKSVEGADELPRTASGTIDRRAVEQHFR